MNYISEINKFYDWLETNPVSDSSIILWHALMHINNKSGWKVEFAVAISTLELKTSLSRSSVIRARNNLQQMGRIKFKSREGQQSAIYQLIAFHTETQKSIEVHTEPQSATQTVTQTVTQSDTQTVTINKLNKTKQLIQYGFDSATFKKSFDEWLEFRKQKKKPLTQKTLEKQMAFLCQFSEKTAIQIIEKSIMNGWQGLFELKDQPKESENKHDRKPLIPAEQNNW